MERLRLRHDPQPKSRRAGPVLPFCLLVLERESLVESADSIDDVPARREHGPDETPEVTESASASASEGADGPGPAVAMP